MKMTPKRNKRSKTPNVVKTFDLLQDRTPGTVFNIRRLLFYWKMRKLRPQNHWANFKNHSKPSNEHQNSFKNIFHTDPHAVVSFLLMVFSYDSHSILIVRYWLEANGPGTRFMAYGLMIFKAFNDLCWFLRFETTLSDMKNSKMSTSGRQIP